MASARQPPTEDAWNQYKTEIRRLYLIEDRSQKDLLEALWELGLFVTKAQLEYRLKLWNFKKNAEKKQWQYIDKRLAKRKRDGRDSEVILCGRRMKMSKVQKETYRHREVTFVAPPSPQSPTDISLSICTPQPMLMEHSWPVTLPWLRFQSTVAQYSLAQIPQGSLVSGINDTSTDHRFASTSLIPFFLDGLKGQTPSLSKLASTIGITMPECYPGENLMRAEIMANSTEPELSREFVLLSIYTLSNNLNLHRFTDDMFDRTITGLKQIGVMGAKFDLRPFANNVTFSAFMEKLFHMAFHQALKQDSRDDRGMGFSEEICEDVGGRTVYDRRKSISIVRWLLETGQNPNTEIWANGHHSSPLQHSLRASRDDLVQLLLNAKADPNFVPGGNIESPLEVAFESIAAYGPVPERVHLLLRAGARVDPPPSNGSTLLHRAAQRGNLDLVRTLVERGAEFRTVRNLTSRLKERLTPLGAAAIWTKKYNNSMPLVEYLTQTMCRNTAIPVTDLLANDVIAAATVGNNDAIRYFHRLSNNIHTPNDDGITPLQVATEYGHKSTCVLLLQLGARLDMPLGQLSSLHLASIGDRVDYIDLLFAHGATLDWGYQTSREANDDFSWDTLLEKSLPDTSLCDLAAVHIATPLHCALRWGNMSSALRLVQLGAQLTGFEILVAAGCHDKHLLCAALARGANPNQRHGSCRTPLQHVLHDLNPWFDSPVISGIPDRLEMAAGLLGAGASLQGGELVSAMRLGVEWVELLQMYDAAPTRTDASGTGILEAAILSRTSAIVAMVDEWYPGLYEAGAVCAAIESDWDLESIKALLHRRPPHNPPQSLEYTAVAMAVAAKRTDVLQSLLDSIEASDRDVLLPDMDWKPVGVFTLSRPFWRDSQDLEEEEDMKEGSPLLSAVWNSDKHLFQQLLNHGFRPSWRSFDIILEMRYPALTKMLIDDPRFSPKSGKASDLLLRRAVGNGDVEMLRLLLRTGAVLDDTTNSRTALQAAVERGDLDMIHLLLEAGANVNAPAHKLGGATALQIAAIQGYLGIAKQLLDLGADPNAQRAKHQGRMALEGAAERGRIDMMELLLHNGVKIKGSNRHKLVRSVFFATARCHYAAADYLRGYDHWTEEDESMLKRFQGKKTKKAASTVAREECGSSLKGLADSPTGDRPRQQQS